MLAQALPSCDEARRDAGGSRARIARNAPSAASIRLARWLPRRSTSCTDASRVAVTLASTTLMRHRATDSQPADARQPDQRARSLRVSDPARSAESTFWSSTTSTRPEQRRGLRPDAYRGWRASVWVATLARAGRMRDGRARIPLILPRGGRRRSRQAPAASVDRSMFIARATAFSEEKDVAGKAMIHARKQKSIARAAALAGEQPRLSRRTFCRCRCWC